MQVKMVFVTLNRNNRNSSVMETSDLDITDYSQPYLLISGHLNIQESNKLRELFGKHFTNMRLSQKKH